MHTPVGPDAASRSCGRLGTALLVVLLVAPAACSSGTTHAGDRGAPSSGGSGEACSACAGKPSGGASGITGMVEASGATSSGSGGAPNAGGMSAHTGLAGKADAGTAATGASGGAPGGGGSLGLAGSPASIGGGGAAARAGGAGMEPGRGRGGAGAGASSGGAGGDTSGAGAAGCAGLVCEDFESGQLDTAKWELVASGGTLTVQSDRAAHGKYAAKVHGVTGSSGDWAILVVKSVPAELKGTTAYGRVYAYVPAEAVASIHVQLAFAGHDGAGAASGPAPFTKLRYMEIASYSGKWQQGFDLLDVSPSVEEVSYSSGGIPTNAWSCVEWQFDDHPDSVTVWVGGAKVASFDNTNVAYASPGPVPSPGSALYDGSSTDIVGGFDTFGFGFHDWHPQKTFDIYYDDLVLDAKRVGCLK
jgi:hypothetical protein